MKDSYVNENRYQFQPWYIKLWRRRYYLFIPISTICLWFRNDIPLKHCFSIVTGMVQIRMNWTYTLEEMDMDL